MKTQDDEAEGPDNMDLLRRKAEDCGPACSCNAAKPPGKARWVIGAIVLVAAGVMVVRAMTKGDTQLGRATEAVLVAPAATTPPADKAGPVTEASQTSRTDEAVIGTSINGLADLNTAAAETDAVFVFLPGKVGARSNPPAEAMKGAARIIQGQGYKVGLFTLKADGSDYDQIAAQMPVPGVLAAVKGRGMFPVSGDITETKLVQGFVAASRGGGCGPSGCGPSGCK